jgi:ATP-dependent helicase/nuclease subunit A
VIAADREVRRRLVEELDTTFFVEAGAGTGKTRELVERIVSLVANGQLSIDGLVAITFTEAAAAELRDRVRQSLALAACDADTWPDSTCRERCREAALQIDVAAIETIHAFAASLLRTFPLEAGLPPGFSISDDIQQDQAFDERFRQWLYDEVPLDDGSGRRQAVARCLNLGMTPDRLRELARPCRSNTTWCHKPCGGTHRWQRMP